MTMMTNRCCHCGCEPVNFKQFDFSDGTLNWEKLLWSPMVATNGDVYAITYDAEKLATEGTDTVTGATGSITLPTPSGNNDDVYFRIFSVDQFNSAGTSQGNSGDFGWVETTFAGVAIDHNTLLLPGEAFSRSNSNRGMQAAGRCVNSSGWLDFSLGQPVLKILTDGSHDGGLVVTYHLDFFPVSIGTLQLDMDSEGTPDAHSPANFDIYDSAATVSGLIGTAFGTNVTDVTVTGTSIGESGLKIVITWDDAQHYLKTYSVASVTKLGALYTRSLQDTNLKSYYDNAKYSSSYLNVGFWQDNGELFRVSGDTADATKNVVESLGLIAGSAPQVMSLTWTDSPLASSTPINADEASPLEEVEWGSGGGLVGITFPLTATIDGPANERMSVITWNDDGTGEEVYDNAGNHFTGDHPYGLCFEEGGTSISVQSLDWRDHDIVADFGDSYATSNYRSENGDATINFTSGSGYSLTHSINRGDYSFQKVAGFNSTSCAFSVLGEARTAGALEVDSTATGLIGTQCAIEGSNIFHTVTALEINWFAMVYHAGSLQNSLSDENTQWRLRWVEGANVVQHIWMQETASLADLNAELLTVFGTDFNGGQNVLASVSADASPISVPIYKRGLSIEAHGATNDSTDDEGEMSTPSFFTNPGSTAVLGYDNMPTLYIDIEDYTFAPAISSTFGAINWSTGAETWGRHFNASGAPTDVRECVLHGSNLHVLSEDSHCGET
jgi:hypothetical protein